MFVWNLFNKKKKKALACGKVQKDTELFSRLVSNLTTRFDFRLTNRFDHCEHANKMKANAQKRQKLARMRLETEQSENSDDLDKEIRREIEILKSFLTDAENNEEEGLLTILAELIDPNLDEEQNEEALLQALRDMVDDLREARLSSPIKVSNTNLQQEEEDATLLQCSVFFWLFFAD
ncbi:hypothetical protein RFI_24464 [Reticulomyxa filosa]|uniref:Uncharacterized protein n=1 Tax=Reticulomyxa filosa TaxID=46433 RepID=X6MIP4_RETFI|nr:hypothetical protein RFI_24464 [Reticulomyxa filosa]|eukprot:ETO12910.1 hypothetical protein RFI_24464 [Reticulomyxa filosa]